MKDLVKKAVLFGVGVAALSKDQIDGFVKELQKKKIIDVKEGKKFVNDLIKESKKSEKIVEQKIEKKVKSTINSMLIATKKDLAALEKRIRSKL